MPSKRAPEQPWERQKGESARAFEAFSLYLEVGPERSIRAVGQRLGKSRALVERWSSAYHWQERVRAWDNHLQQEARRTAEKTIRDMHRRHAQMAVQIQGAAMKALTELGSDMVDQKNFAAIVRLAVELERTSRQAEAAERQERGAQQEDDPLTAALKEELGDAVF